MCIEGAFVEEVPHTRERHRHWDMSPFDVDGHMGGTVVTIPLDDLSLLHSLCVRYDGNICMLARHRVCELMLG
jgi:hypothetical protein